MARPEVAGLMIAQKIITPNRYRVEFSEAERTELLSAWWSVSYLLDEQIKRLDYDKEKQKQYAKARSTFQMFVNALERLR
jgi:hypothetical protein